MADASSEMLKGRRLLIVEDEYMIAADLAWWLEDQGAEVVGPAGSVDEAIALIAAEDGRLDGAVLDINLGHEPVFPVADRLLAAGVPFVFMTGYGGGIVPDAYATVPRHEKPFDRTVLLRVLSNMAAQGSRQANVASDEITSQRRPE